MSTATYLYPSTLLKVGMRGVLIEINDKKDLLVYIAGDTDNRWIATENYLKISVVPNIYTTEDVIKQDADAVTLTTQMQQMCQLTDA